MNFIFKKLRNVSIFIPWGTSFNLKWKWYSLLVNLDRRLHSSLCIEKSRKWPRCFLLRSTIKSGIVITFTWRNILELIRWKWIIIMYCIINIIITETICIIYLEPGTHTLCTCFFKGNRIIIKKKSWRIHRIYIFLLLGYKSWISSHLELTCGRKISD